MRGATPALILLIIWTVELPVCSAEFENFDLRGTDGWGITDLRGGKVEGASLRAMGGALEFAYRRKTLSPLIHAAALTDLQKIRLTLQSQQDAAFMLGVEDRDGASFHYAFNLKAGIKTAIEAGPGDFKLNDDSKVKKPAGLNPKRLGYGYVILDLAPVLGGDGENRLAISKVELERKDLRRQTGPLVVSAPQSLSENGFRDGPIIIRKGGHL